MAPTASKSNSPASAAVSALLGGMLGGAAGCLVLIPWLTELLRASPLRGGRELTVFLALPVAWLVAAVLHELGHVLTGKLAGFRFQLFIVGPLKIEAVPGGHLRFSLNRNVLLAGGLAGLLPTGERALRQRCAWFVAGGPLVSLLLGAVALVIGATWTRDVVQSVTPALAPVFGAAAWLFLGAMSLAVGFVTLWPTTQAGMMSDGRRLARLLGDPDAGDRDASVMALVGALSAGLRIRALSPTLLARASEHDDTSPTALHGKLLAYHYWLLQGDAGRAGRHLLDVVQRGQALPRTTRDIARAELAWWLADHRADPAAARAALAEAGSMAAGGVTRLCAESAIALADGNPTLAAQLADAARAALIATSPNDTPLPDALERIDALRARIRSRK